MSQCHERGISEPVVSADTWRWMQVELVAITIADSGGVYAR